MKDLTQGNPYKLILLFALPVFVGCVFQQLYNMVDTVIVSNTVNAYAFTGVGLTGSITFVVLGFTNGLTSGFSVRIAQRFGAKDMDGVRHFVAMGYVLCAIVSVVLTAVSVPITGALLRLMKISEECYPYAYAYLFVIFCGIAASVFYNMNAGILRAVGDSRTPLYFLIAAAILNVGFDFAFIVGCKMHYTGAACATVLSQLLSGFGCLAFTLLRHPELRTRRGDWKWNTKTVFGHMAVGIPMALQFSITGIGLIIQQTALNGVAAVWKGADTAYVAASKIDNLAMQSTTALGTAIATFAGQNSGAGKYDRVERGVRVGMIYVLICWAAGIAFCMGLYDPLMELFLDTGDSDLSAYMDDIWDYGRRFLLFESTCYVFVGIINIYRNALQGVGKSGLSMFGGVFELLGRAVTAFVFVKIWNYTGFCLSNPVAWIFADVFFLIAYYVVMAPRISKRAPSREPRIPSRAKWL